MEGQYIRGTKGVGAYEGGGNDESGGNVVGLILGFLSGTPEGAVIIGAVTSVFDVFNGGPSEWEDAGPGVHAWYTANGEEDLKWWCRTHYPESFGSVDAAKAMRMQWIFQGAPAQNGSFLVREKGTIQGLAEPRYMLSSMAKAAEVWAAIGVDLPRTIENRQAQGGGIDWIPPNHIITVPGFLRAVEDVVDETISNVENGEALTDEEADVAEELLREAEREEQRTAAVTILTAAAAVATLAK